MKCQSHHIYTVNSVLLLALHQIDLDFPLDHLVKQCALGSSCGNLLTFCRSPILQSPRADDNVPISLLGYKTALIKLLKKGIWRGFEQHLMPLEMNRIVTVPGPDRSIEDRQE